MLTEPPEQVVNNMKSPGFKFFGTTIYRAYMQAAVLVNNYITNMVSLLSSQ